MAANVNYNRAKSTTTNSTDINIDFTAGEEPTALTALGPATDNSGTSGILNVTVTADADESGGADIQDLFRIEDIQVLINATTGLTQLSMSIIPVKGGATDGTTTAVLVNHPETMDAWQTAAGRARQA
jgi:hypothetical protein